MEMYKFWWFSTCLFFIITTTTEECPNSDYSFEHYLSTKTPYRIVSNKSFDEISFKGCRPKKLWMIIRHGTRNPNIKVIEQMKSRLPEIRDLVLESNKVPSDIINNRDLDLFRAWKPPKLDSDDEKSLTHEGEDEMLLLAERMQSKFPDIFGYGYSNSSYRFKFTHSQRTKKSALYFTAGLFGRQTVKDVYFPEPSKLDVILRFYKLCQKWIKDVKGKLKHSGEHKSFQNGSEMNNVVKEVNERLGLRKEDQLDTDDILLIYTSCAFETAWNKRRKSPWCSLLRIENFKVLEYMEDLKYYGRDGYGYPLTYMQACPTFGDMINFLQSEEPLPKATVYFTHSGTMLKLLAHLGLYKDASALTSGNFKQMFDRKWRTSRIDPFGGNLAFVLFRCGNDKKILTMHQENIIRLPGCVAEDLCDITTIKEYYEQSLQSCDFNEMCENENEFEF